MRKVKLYTGKNIIDKRRLTFNFSKLKSIDAKVTNLRLVPVMISLYFKTKIKMFPYISWIPTCSLELIPNSKQKIPNSVYRLFRLPPLF